MAEVVRFYIGDALEKEQRKNVALEVSGIDRTAEDVGGFPKMGLQLA